MAYDYRDYETLMFGREARILTVTLNRPEQMNAVNARMHAELARVFYEVNADPDIDVVILTGAGRAFSAGGDLNWLEAMAGDQAAFARTIVEGKTTGFSSLAYEGQSNLTPDYGEVVRAFLERRKPRSSGA